MSNCKIIRHALLLVFEYKRVEAAIDTPNPLLSMDKDLTVAYNLCRDRFKIPPQNISIVTDLRPQRGVMGPWDPLDNDPMKNPRIVRLYVPDIAKICREIAQFVENTVRGIREITTKSGDVIHEVFIYISGHGAQIPNPCRHADNDEEMDNALIFTSADGKSRSYLRDDIIFQILFGLVDIEHDGTMTVPITTRKLKRSKEDGSLYYQFSDSMVSFRLTPGVKERIRPVELDEKPEASAVVAYTPRGHPRFVKDRGLPITTHMLTLIDTCHSGTMTDFHYIYNPLGQRMELTRKPPADHAFPLCICLSAACDQEEAPSTTTGSTFTRYIQSLFMGLRGTVTVREIYEMIYAHLPKLLERCRPTITATIDDPDCFLPLLDTSMSDTLPLPSEHVPVRKISKADSETFVGRLINKFES